MAGLLILLVLVASAPAADIEVAFQNPTKVDLKQWPVRVGLPLRAGENLDPDRLGLLGDAGASGAVQTRVLSRWPDGSPRWLLIDARLDLPAGATVKRQITGRAAGAASGRLASETDAAVVVDTGRLRFEIPKQQFSLMSNGKLDGHPVAAGPVVSQMVIDGQNLTAGPPEQVRIVENGALRSVVEVRGRYSAGFRYIMRIEASAGQTWLRVLHRFESHSPDKQNHLSQLSVRIPLPAGDRRPRPYRLGRVAQAPIEGRYGKEAWSATQLDNLRFELPRKKGTGRLDGTVIVGQGEKAIAVVARWFWEQYPQAFELGTGELVYHLWAPAGGTTPVGSGSAKSHEVVLAFGSDAMRLAQHPGSVAAPLIGHPAAPHVRASGALRNSLAASAASAAFLEQLKAGLGRYREHRSREVWDDRDEPVCPEGDKLPQRRRTGFFGMWNWGDWNFPGYHDDTKGCDAWGNLEYDLTQVMGLGFAASGDAVMLDEMAAAARHFMDVDSIHYSAAHPDWVGMNHPKNPRHFTFELGGVDLGHTWTEGLISYAMMTGDDRGLDAARAIAEYLVRRSGSFLKGNPRQWGWPQIALVAAYEATTDVRYREAALVYARGSMGQHAPALGKDWKIGILAEGLAYTHSVSGDPEIAEWLKRYAAAIAAAEGKRDVRLLPAVAYAGRINQQPTYTKLAADAAHGLQFGNWGKPLTIAGRLGFAILSQQ